jgi:hypothetical protein
MAHEFTFFAVDEKENARFKEIYHEMTTSLGKKGIDTDSFKEFVGFPASVALQVLRVFAFKKLAYLDYEGIFLLHLYPFFLSIACVWWLLKG